LRQGFSRLQVATFLVGLSFPVMLRLLDVGGSYLVYGVLNIAALAFCWVRTLYAICSYVQTVLFRSLPFT
jgi:hypothetical protein